MNIWPSTNTLYQILSICLSTTIQTTNITHFTTSMTTAPHLEGISPLTVIATTRDMVLLTPRHLMMDTKPIIKIQALTTTRRHSQTGTLLPTTRNRALKKIMDTKDLPTYITDTLRVTI